MIEYTAYNRRRTNQKERGLLLTPEGRVKALVNRRVATFAAQSGDRVYRFMPVQNGMGAPGLDYFFCVNGHFVAVETKVPGKDLTPRQTITQAAIKKAGGRVYVVHNAKECDEMIKDWGDRFFVRYGATQVKDAQGLTKITATVTWGKNDGH